MADTSWAGEPITEEWLKASGFQWHQLDRQPDKHWLLWCGDATGQARLTSYEDIGIELAPAWWRNRRGEEVNAEDRRWFCWFRSDAAGRYHRFIHVRHLRTRGDLVGLVEAVTGQSWNPDFHLYGSVRTPEQAALILQREQDMDRRLMRERPSWSEVEEDATRGRALPEHLEAHAKAQSPHLPSCGEGG